MREKTSLQSILVLRVAFLMLEHDKVVPHPDEYQYPYNYGPDHHLPSYACIARAGASKVVPDAGILRKDNFIK